MISADALSRDVPKPEERLERHDLREPGLAHGEDRGLDLVRRWKVRAEDPAGAEGGRNLSQHGPRLGEVEDDAVEALPGPGDVSHVPRSELQPRRNLPEERFHVH